MSTRGPTADGEVTGGAGSPATGVIPDASLAGVAPRRRRRRWVWWLAAGYVGLLVVVRLLWGWEAQRRFDAAVAKYRALGQPVLIEDFARPAIPDAENGGLLIEEALRRLQLSKDQSLWMDAALHASALIREHRGQLTPVVEAASEAHALVRRAREFARIAWGPPLTSPVINVLLPNLASMRQLAKALCLRAEVVHVDGNDEEAVRSVGDVLTLVRATEGHTPCLITHLVATAINGLACASVQELLPELAIEDGLPAAGVVAPASRVTVQTLITSLLDDASNQTHLSEALCAERASLIDLANLFSAGRYNVSGIATSAGLTPARSPNLLGRLQDLILRPLFLLDGVRMMDNMSATIAAAQANDWASRLGQGLSTPSPGGVSLQSGTRPLSTILMPSFDGAVSVHFRGVAQRRMAGVALAIRLYAHDHGRLPTALADLVPDYLPALPSDPFAPAGRGFGYLADAELPCVYSLHLNGADDGGQFTVRPDGGVDRDSLDMPFFVATLPPRTKAELPDWLTEALEREHEPEEAERQADADAQPDNSP